ncbi:MAG: ATP-binding protein [Spirochaetales bacterium]|jgi:signal transduction histidine kinase|nr:ATP-binding protein [Spirochaetales bacterium]
MEDISLHVMDIAENSITGGATKIEVQIVEDHTSRRLLIVLGDNGRGMDEEELEKALDPFYTSKEGKRIGLGLPLFRQTAVESGGEMNVVSTPGNGTEIRAWFDLDHPDIRPLGDIEGTVNLLKAFHPEVEFTYRHEHKVSSGQGGQDEVKT